MLAGRVADPRYLEAILLEAHHRNPVELEECGVYVRDVEHRVVLE
jgi:hypothetical protein